LILLFLDTFSILSFGASFLQNLSSTHGSGGVLDLFYEPWKLKVAENERLWGAMCDLWEAYAAQHPDFWHPFGPFDPDKGFMYIDRVCFRVPESVNELLRQQ
ncbi:unnamed protein product, partial [Phaeothamnion confervicola]